MALDWSVPERKIYSVSELNRRVRTLLERQLHLIWLEGELSNLSRPASGHLYFSLKDAGAQVRCALFRNRARLLQRPLEHGQRVLVRARVGLYEPRGDYQLLIEQVEETGVGALQRAFQALQKKLVAEGLFALENKQPLPVLARRIGVITSPSGAALRDVLSVLKRRFAGLPVLLYPVPVQGEGAGARIAAALQLASSRAECDVILLVRGGGSLEDLWAFNDERVARAIVASRLPVVSGVGHETDVTIADLAADLRAPTPSAAAELVSPDVAVWQQRLRSSRLRLVQATERRLQTQRQRLDWLEQALRRQHPGQRLSLQRQRLDELTMRLKRSTLHRLSAQRPHLDSLTQQLLAVIQQNTLVQRRQRLALAGRALQAISPLQTLARGYAIVRDADSGVILRSAEQTQIGTQVEVLLDSGQLSCRVEAVVPAKTK